MKKNRISQLRQREKVNETREILRIISNRMAIPLYFLFWICDLIYVPHLKWEFLAIRSLIVPFCLFFQAVVRHLSNFPKAQWATFSFVFCLATQINVMIYFIGDTSSPYYAGLNLVAIGSLSFIPFTVKFFLLTVSGIYLPYYLSSLLSGTGQHSYDALAVNSFFIVGTVTISFFVRYFNEFLRRKELESRLALNKEIKNREKIIETKTDEAVGLARLSSQFSPQIVQAIKNQRIKIDSTVHRRKICAIFIDIVNSTERVTRIDQENVHRVITMFMNDTISTLLKYDITIDKFLGDGILAFSNDPVEYPDFIERTINAALEIKNTLHEKQDIYENYWLSKLEIRTGISLGYANVGFYGGNQYFRSYTAIGPVVNLASRLCAVAEPNQILVPFDVIQKIESKSFVYKFIGKKSLKGFESDTIKAFEIVESESLEDLKFETSDCPNCGSIMHIDTNSSGIYLLRCRACGHEMGQIPLKDHLSRAG